MIIGPFKGEYRFLSNFYPAEVMFEEVLYPTVEHAYQAAKTLRTDMRLRIRDQATPGGAKREGREVVLREDWDYIKVDIMQDLVFKKFTTHSDLREKLLATGDAELVEINHWHDTFWGMCNKIGANRLGRILMKVRGDLR